MNIKVKDTHAITQDEYGNPESIFGGTELPEGLRPFLVGLARCGGNGCGGSLIGEKVVLTAARKSTFSTQYTEYVIYFVSYTNTLLLILFLFLDCLTVNSGNTPSDTAYEPFEKVNVGVYDYGSDIADVDYTSFDFCFFEELGFCDPVLAYGIRHPLWTPGPPGTNLGGGKVGYDYDFALIFLPSANYNTTAIKPVMLNTDPNIPKADDEVNTFGWGAAGGAKSNPNPNPSPSPGPTEDTIFPTTIFPTYFPEIPQTANLSYLTPKQCNESQYVATDSMLCAESAGASVGTGDSGK